MQKIKNRKRAKKDATKVLEAINTLIDNNIDHLHSTLMNKIGVADCIIKITEPEFLLHACMHIHKIHSSKYYF